MQGTGNYSSAFGPSASACRFAFAPAAGEGFGVRRAFPAFIAKKDAEEVKKSVDNLEVTRKMILSLSLSLSHGYARQYTQKRLNPKGLAFPSSGDYPHFSTRYGQSLLLPSPGGRSVLLLGGMRNMAMPCPCAADAFWGYAVPCLSVSIQNPKNIETNIA